MMRPQAVLAAMTLWALVGGAQVVYGQVFQGLRPEIRAATNEFGSREPRFLQFQATYAVSYENYYLTFAHNGGTCEGLAVYIQWCLEGNAQLARLLGYRHFGVAVWKMPNGFPDPIASGFDPDCNEPVPSDACAQKASAAYAGAYEPPSFQQRLGNTQYVGIVVWWIPDWQLPLVRAATLSLAEAVRPAMEYCTSPEAVPEQSSAEPYIIPCLLNHMRQHTGRDVRGITLLLILPRSADSRRNLGPGMNDAQVSESGFSNPSGGAYASQFSVDVPRIPHSLGYRLFPLWSRFVRWQLIILQDLQRP